MYLPPQLPLRVLLVAHNADYNGTWHLGTPVRGARAAAPLPWAQAAVGSWEGWAARLPAGLLIRLSTSPGMQEREAWVYSMLNIPLNTHTRT